MMKAGEPVAYQTTDEGALAWVDGITLSAKAEILMKHMNSSITALLQKLVERLSTRLATTQR